MPKVKLNSKLVCDLPHPIQGQQLYFDSSLEGFGLRVTKNTKTYIVQGRVRGRTKRPKIGKHPDITLSDARREAKKMLGLIARGIDPIRQKQLERNSVITLEEALDLFLAHRSLRPSSASEYKRTISGKFKSWLKTPLGEVTPQDAVNRFNQLSQKSGFESANKSLRILQSIYEFARAATADQEGRYVLPENPVKRISDLRLWHKPNRNQLFLDDQMIFETMNELSSLNRPVFANYLELLLRTGMRRNEAASLTWDSVDLRGRVFTIRPENAKNGKALKLPMSLQVEDIFLRLKPLNPPTDSSLVFPSTRKSTSRYDPRKSLQKLNAELSQPITYHSLRRTFAVLAERSDVSLSKIKRMMNHADGNDVTFRYLINDDPERLRGGIQKISDEIDRVVHSVNHLRKSTL